MSMIARRGIAKTSFRRVDGRFAGEPSWIREDEAKRIRPGIGRQIKFKFCGLPPGAALLDHGRLTPYAHLENDLWSRLADDQLVLQFVAALKLVKDASLDHARYRIT